jgi:Tol biopolymer transport system component
VAAVLRPLLAFLTLALVLGSAASAGPAKSNGLVAFGVCCGSEVGIYVIKPNGTGQKRIYKPKFDDASLDTAWSPKGTRIAYVATGGLWTMSSTGIARKQVTKGKGDTISPGWSTDGNRIAFVDLLKKGSRKYALYLIGADGSGLKRLVVGTPYVNDPAWSPSGKVIMFDRSDALWTVRPDGKGLTKIGEGTSPAWSPDSRHVAFDRKGDVWTMNASGTGPKILASVRSGTAGIAWSPDGQWIVYAQGDRGDLQLIHPDGTGTKRLTHQPDLFNSWPAWQPKP